MTSLIFIDTDILFNLLAINQEKKEKYAREGTTGDTELDQLIITFLEESRKFDKICISNFSVLELLCTLNRLKSEFKIPGILKKIYETYDILKIDENIIYLAWFFGSNYRIHSGDAIHVSFCLMNRINLILIKEREFYETIQLIIKDDKKKTEKSLENFFKNLSLQKEKYKILNQALNHSNNLEIKRLG